ncbi:MAG: RNA methyltransferase [Saprospiraceae bacterium]|nr:RNA methyltransferase [Saprospiraceae bacterium]
MPSITKDSITEERSKRFKETIAKRQDITVILENVHDPHNIGAVIRSCDAVGISEVYILYSEASFNFVKQKIGKNTSSGARKWVKAHYFADIDQCFKAVRKKYSKVYGTHLSESSCSLYSLDLTEPVALMFGNEQKGITEAAMQHLDGNFIIPMYGMVQSLNISVACAVSLFEASRQRNQKNMYKGDYDEGNEYHLKMFDSFVEKHFDFNIKNEK